MNNIFSKKYLFLFLIFLVLFLSYVGLSYKDRLAYNKEQDCSRTARAFIDGKNKGNLVTWNIMQSKFNIEEKACFVEVGQGGINYIYDLTHNKEVSLLPAEAGMLYPNVKGGEINKERIELINIYNTTKQNIFK